MSARTPPYPLSLVLTYLLSLHEVGHVAIIVDTPGMETGASALTADAGDEAGLGLLVRCVHGSDGHYPTHHL